MTPTATHPAHVTALRVAEDELERIDREIADHAARGKELRDERKAAAARVREAIDVLLGRATPTLFDAAEPAGPVEAQVEAPVEARVEAPPEPADADTGGLPDAVRKQGLALIGLPKGVLDRLTAKAEIATVGELWDWVEEDGAADGGMAHANGAGLWACLKAIGVKRDIDQAVGAVYAFLESKGCDPRRLPKSPTPVVCAPVGSLPLAKVAGFPPAAADLLQAGGVRTLADLERLVEQQYAAHDSPPADLGERIVGAVRARFAGVLTTGEAHEVADAVVEHLFAAGAGRPKDPRPVVNPPGKPAPKPAPTPAADSRVDWWEAEIAARRAKGDLSPADERLAQLIADYRHRQAVGDAAPAWGRLSEFAVTLADGRTVRVYYEPGRGPDSDHFEFFGGATSSTGYRSHHQGFPAGRPRGRKLEAWALDFVEQLAEEAAAETKRAAKKRPAAQKGDRK